MNNQSSGLKIVRSIAETITQSPIQIQETRGEHTILITLRAKKRDLKYLIGRNGETSRALQTILRNIGGKERCRYILDIGSLPSH